MTTLPTTAFGAVLDHPTRTSSVLRARASAAGLQLRPVAALDACAAVLAAHCWALATGRTSVTASMTHEEAGALAPALARASGHGSPVQDVQESWCAEVYPVPDHVMAQVVPVVRWAHEHAGAPAVALAAGDLATSQDARVVALAQHLATYADADVPFLVG